MTFGKPVRSPKSRPKSERVRIMLRRAKTEATARYSTTGRDKRDKLAPITLPGVKFLTNEA